MRTIWKFPLATAPVQELSMPEGARVIALQMQFGEPCLWAEVDIEALTEIRRFLTFGTGYGVDDGPVYIGTYQLQGGTFVFHVYEEVR